MNAPLRIAVADDEPDMRDYFARILPALGHNVVAVAADGEELLELCQTTCPDLVITDVKMPRVGGLEVARRLGERGVPVLLVSACHDDGSLPKPVRKADLRAAIERVMGQRFQPDERGALAPCCGQETGG